MLNLGFWELVVIGTVALVVIGPKRLPEAARFCGHFVRRIRNQVNTVKADIQREIALEDMKKIHQEFQDAASDANKVFTSGINNLENSMRDNLSDSHDIADKAEHAAHLPDDHPAAHTDVPDDTAAATAETAPEPTPAAAETAATAETAPEPTPAAAESASEPADTPPSSPAKPAPAEGS